MSHKLLVMGVSGCGKSTVAARLAQALEASLIEGDDYHLPQSQQKMEQGIPLTDDDRDPWLDRLGALLAASDDSVVLTCSALKRRYRDRLRAAEPALKIVFLDIDIEEARRRVGARRSHFFPASLVDNQFQTLESPVDEAGVLRVETTLPLEAQCEAVLRWLDIAPSPNP